MAAQSEAGLLGEPLGRRVKVTNVFQRNKEQLAEAVEEGEGDGAHI